MPAPYNNTDNPNPNGKHAGGQPPIYSNVEDLQVTNNSCAIQIKLGYAKYYLQKSINFAENFSMVKSISKLKNAIYNLECLNMYGINTSFIINSIMTTINDSVLNKVKDAEVLRGTSNKWVTKAWVKYDCAVKKYQNGYYSSATNYFTQAVKYAEMAITEWC